MKKASFMFIAALLGLLMCSVSNIIHGVYGFVAIDNDVTPPTTIALVGEPKSYDANGTTIVSSNTLITLVATDNAAGSGVFSTAYRLYSDTYNKGWLTYSGPINLAGLSDGQYYLAYSSTDRAGNTEGTRIVPITVSLRQTELRPVYVSINIPTLLGMITVAGALIGSAFIFIADAEVMRRRRRKRKAELNAKTHKPLTARDKR